MPPCVVAMAKRIAIHALLVDMALEFFITENAKSSLNNLNNTIIGRYSFRSRMEQLIDFFEKSGFSALDAIIIAQKFSPRTFKKGELLLEVGNINRHLGFVESGNFMFYVLANGEEKTTYIVGKNEFVASLKSFLKEVPSREYIRSINESKAWFITKSDLDRLLLEINGFQRFYIQVLENEICCIEDSRYNFLSLNAEQRYLKLMQEEPHLLQNIPLQYLASILGISPRHLSRIRAKI